MYKFTVSSKTSTDHAMYRPVGMIGAVKITGHHSVNGIEGVKLETYRICMDKHTDFELCMKKAVGVKSMEPGCQLTEQVKQLTDRYEGVVQLVQNTLHNLRQAVQIHTDYEHHVAETGEWLSSLSERVAQCSCPIDTTDRTELERRLANGRILSQTLSGEISQHLDPLARLVEQLLQSSDTTLSTTVHAQVDSFRTTAQELAHQLGQSQRHLQEQLERWVQWTETQSETTQFLDGLASQLVGLVTETRKRDQEGKRFVVTSKRMVSMKQTYVDQLKRIRQEFEDSRSKIENLHRVANNLSTDDAPKAEVSRQTELAEERFNRMQQEVEIRLKKAETTWQRFSEFSTQLNEAENWIFSTSLKLLAIHATDPDGPLGVFQLGRVHKELTDQLQNFRFQTLPKLSLLAKACQAEYSADERGDQSLPDWFQTATGISAGSAEQIATTVLELQAAVKEQVGSTSSAIRVSPFQTEVTQLEAGLKSLCHMSEQVKERLLEQQNRWARFVSVLARVADYLKLELPEWWNKRPNLPSHRGQNTVGDEGIKVDWRTVLSSSDESDEDTSKTAVERPMIATLTSQDIESQLVDTEATVARLMLFTQELSSERARCHTSPPKRLMIPTSLVSVVQQRADPATLMAEILGDAYKQPSGDRERSDMTLTGTELSQRAARISEALKRAVDRLNDYIAKLHDLRTAWDQQQLCEAEFDSWLRRKERELDEAVNRPGRRRRHSASGEQVLSGPLRRTYSQLANAMDTGPLEALLHEVKAKEPVLKQLRADHIALGGSENLLELDGFSKRLHALRTRLVETVSARRELIDQAMEATRLTDNLHGELHQLVRQSAGLDTGCFSHSDLHQIRTPRRSIVTSSTSGRSASSKRPIFWASSTNLTENRDVASTSRRSGFQSPVSTVPTKSTHKLDQGLSRSSDNLVPNMLDWLWYSPSTVLGESSVRLTPDESQTPRIDPRWRGSREDEMEHEHPGLSLSGSSSKTSLLFSRPWTSYRNLECSSKKPWPDWRAHITSSDGPPVAQLCGTSEPTTSDATVQRLTESMHVSFELPHFEVPVSSAEFTRRSEGSIFQQVTSHTPVSCSVSEVPFFGQDVPMLLRRSISPVPTRTRRPSSRAGDLWSAEDRHRLHQTSPSMSTEFTNLVPRISRPTSSIPTRPVLSVLTPNAGGLEASVGRARLPSELHRELPFQQPRTDDLSASHIASDLDNLLRSGRPPPMGASISDSAVTLPMQSPNSQIGRQMFEIIPTSRTSRHSEVQPTLPSSLTYATESTRRSLDTRHPTPAEIAIQRYRQLRRQTEHKHPP
ncbi:hypothetical protein T265_01318 [Opisthorchis viverrini]|uniref:Spectrin repeat-containing domain protein n=1 Tax=Opisthorchis viverrini TaxID=6198 RepID=A0A075AJ22_OPIVI|nr:hypothetical protein T265_01318 [Opisthorchis viverrini]KER32629.1 hypothetical protein T265_01318 [Opisthorchis viverrini]